MKIGVTRVGPKSPAQVQGKKPELTGAALRKAIGLEIIRKGDERFEGIVRRSYFPGCAGSEVKGVTPFLTIACGGLRRAN